MVEDSELESEIQKPHDIVENILKTSKKVYSTLNPAYLMLDSEVRGGNGTREKLVNNPNMGNKTEFREKSSASKDSRNGFDMTSVSRDLGSPPSSVIDGSSIKRQFSETFKFQNEGPFLIKTVTTADARSVEEKVKDNAYCSERNQFNAFMGNREKSDPRFFKRSGFVSSSENSQKGHCPTPVESVKMDSTFDKDQKRHFSRGSPLSNRDFSEYSEYGKDSEYGTESVTSGVADKENGEVSKVDSQRDARSVATQENENSAENSRKRLKVPPELLNQLDIDELEELGSLALHIAQKKRDYSEKYLNTTPSGSKRLNWDETPELSTQNKLASSDASVFDGNEDRESSSTLGTQNRNKEVVPRDYFLMINKEQIINPKYTKARNRRRILNTRKIQSTRQIQNMNWIQIIEEIQVNQRPNTV